MIPMLPRWIWLWAATLPAVAGSTNAIALLALRHGGVTHLTGISTEGAIGLGTHDVHLLFHAAGVILLFLFGCALSAALLRAPRWTPSAMAACLLILEAMVLAAAAWMLPEAPWLGVTLCAGAMGLQNGLTSLVSGALLRTSHLTGMFTDLGTALGQLAWRGPVDRRRVAVCAVVIVSFATGAAVAAACYARWNGQALIANAVGVMAVAAATWRLHRARQIAQYREPEQSAP